MLQRRRLGQRRLGYSATPHCNVLNLAVITRDEYVQPTTSPWRRLHLALYTTLCVIGSVKAGALKTHSFIHSRIYVAPLQGNYSEVLPTPEQSKKNSVHVTIEYVRKCP